MSALVGRSQGAAGALQATQAGNQLLALQAQQLSDLTAVVAANGRADALSAAERSAAAEQGREQRRRFLTPGSGRSEASREGEECVSTCSCRWSPERSKKNKIKPPNKQE